MKVQVESESESWNLWEGNSFFKVTSGDGSVGSSEKSRKVRGAGSLGGRFHRFWDIIKVWVVWKEPAQR